MKYISILRGINVSGQKKIKMADLKSLYEKEGFDNVTTYIQSGNVLFDTKKRKIEEIKIRIESAIKGAYGFDVPVDVRTTEEYLNIINACPYEEAKIEENGTKVLVSFLSDKPSKDKKSQLEERARYPERLKIEGSVVYLYCPNGYGKSKLTNTFIESKLGLVATTRNWKTVSKLVEMGQ
jgi:uncharacterized protein (DUF1697 family)